MLSRTAEALFWMGRYMERAEYTARFTNVHYHLLLGSDDPDEHSRVWQRYLQSTGELTTYHSVYPDLVTPSVVEFLTLDKFNPNSIVRLVWSAPSRILKLAVLVAVAWGRRLGTPRDDQVRRT